MKFFKYHALGNTYIVLDTVDVCSDLPDHQIRLICSRNYGIGSDGILMGSSKSSTQGFGLRIFNPDGSEAEKSGNGVCIFSRYLWDKGAVQKEPFSIVTRGGEVKSLVNDNGRSITVELGKVSFDSGKIPVEGPHREVINETMIIEGEKLNFCAATIGNPHCVVLYNNPRPEIAKRFGPLIEKYPIFPNRTNVQFMKVVDKSNIQIEIWERGAGYTTASGTSSSAASAVARRLGLCDSNITVHMPGGKIQISISDEFSISMRGSVTKICEGMVSHEIFD